MIERQRNGECSGTCSPKRAHENARSLSEAEFGPAPRQRLEAFGCLYTHLCIYFGTKPTPRAANDSRHRCIHSSILRRPPFVPSHLPALGHAGEALPRVSMRRVGVGRFVRGPSPLCASRPFLVPLRAVSAEPNRIYIHMYIYAYIYHIYIYIYIYI